MSYPLRFSEEAGLEAQQAVSWYEDQENGLGYEFLCAVDEVLNNIETSPLMYPVDYDTVHRALVNRFPYFVIYEIVNGEISILSIFHSSRNWPEDWKARE